MIGPVTRSLEPGPDNGHQIRVGKGQIVQCSAHTTHLFCSLNTYEGGGENPPLIFLF